MNEGFVSYEEFKKLDIRIGTVKSVEPVEGTDKLLKCMIDFNEEGGLRQIVSGIRPYFEDPQVLVGRQLLYILNLEPRTICGVERRGMLLAVGEGEPTFLIPEKEVQAGARLR